VGYTSNKEEECCNAAINEVSSFSIVLTLLKETVKIKISDADVDADEKV